jgi:hypothetical protein
MWLDTYAPLSYHVVSYLLRRAHLIRKRGVN